MAGSRPTITRAGLTDRAVDRPVVFAPDVDVAGEGAALAGAIRALQSTIDSCGPGGLPPVVAAEFERTVLNLLLLTHRHNYSEQLTEYISLPPPRVVGVAVDHIEATPEGTLSVGELARVAGVGERALQLAFRRHLGTTPAAYLRQVRPSCGETRERHDRHRRRAAARIRPWWPVRRRVPAAFRRATLGDAAALRRLRRRCV